MKRLLRSLLVALLVVCVPSGQAAPFFTGLNKGFFTGGGIFAGSNGPFTNAVPIPGPSFSLPLTDAGSGAVNLTPSFAAGSATPTFTRATTAWTKLSTGLWASVASGTARSSYLGANTSVGLYGGYLAEGARTNSALQARDHTNASWTKTTMTAALDQTGIDGAANSASSLLATAGNATSTQTITLASNAKTLSFFIKCIVCLGAVQISLDNFATNTDVTALVNSSTYTRVSMTQTLANPTIGIRLTTNADKIAVDMSQLEDLSSFASSPIPTTTVAVTRNADVLTYASSGNAVTAQGTIYSEASFEGTTTGTIVAIHDGSLNNSVESITNGVGANNASEWVVRSGGVVQANLNNGSTSVNTVDKRAGYWNTNLAQQAFNGTLGTLDSLVTVPAALTTIQLAINGGGANQLFGTIRNVRIWTTQLPNATLQTITK